MTDEEIAFYDIIMKGREYLENDAIARKIAIDVVDTLKKNLKIDWLNQDHVKAGIRNKVRDVLLNADFPVDKIDDMVPVIMQQTETNYREVGFDS